MTSRPRVPIGQQYAALMRLKSIADHKGRKLLPAAASSADLDYITTGLSGAIDTLLYVREHRDVIIAAVAAAQAAAKANAAAQEPVT